MPARRSVLFTALFTLLLAASTVSPAGANQSCATAGSKRAPAVFLPYDVLLIAGASRRVGGTMGLARLCGDSHGPVRIWT